MLQESGSRGLGPSLLRPPASSPAIAQPPPTQPEVTVLVPTRDERESISPLMARLERIEPTLRLDVLFVDDSDDQTAEAIRELADRCSRPVGVIHRPPGHRDGGLGGAVVAGIEAARSEWICVMDADLQHPPELIGALLAKARRSNADVVVASRYCPGGDVGDFSAARAALSRGSGLLARAMFPRRLRGVSDPLSGFFLIRRAAVDRTDLHPRGFKILLEILVSGGTLRTREVPFRFGERYAGESKASLREGLRYLHRLVELRFAGTLELVSPAPPAKPTAATPEYRGRFRHQAPAVWNGNGTAGVEHAPQRSVLT